jgi:GNAT acetyltransferase-like protein
VSAAIKTRPGDPEADRSAVIALLSRYVNPAYDGRRFDWAYRDNPAGPGRFWVAVEGSTGDLIGSAGALPRRMCIDGTHVTGWALTDFCISDTHRSLGPALRLQRACLEDLAGDGGALWYDFPGRSMEAVYRRLGVSPCAHVRRLARPLRTYAKLRERLGSRVLARAASLPADLAIAWATRAPRPGGPVAVAPHRGSLGAEFTDLARRVTPGAGICVWRSAEYLNWRYCDNPVQPHELVTARLEGRLVAYVALTRDGDAAILVDLFGETDALRVLVRSTVAGLRTRGAVGVISWMGDTHPYAALLRELGFRPRETAPVLAGAVAGSPWARAIRDASWLLTYGDRDT